MRLLRNVGMSLRAPVAVLMPLVAAPGADADTGSVKAWGWGVSTGAQQFESCTTTCQAGRAGVGDAGDLWGALGAAVSATGNVLVGNLDLNRVDVFSRDGSFVRTFGGGVAGGAGLQTCTTGCSYGSSGGGAGALSAPWGVASDPSGHVVVAGFGNDRVSVFTESGAFVRTFGWGREHGRRRAGGLHVQLPRRDPWTRCRPAGPPPRCGPRRRGQRVRRRRPQRPRRGVHPVHVSGADDARSGPELAIAIA
jgi:hypothetical protein